MAREGGQYYDYLLTYQSKENSSFKSWLSTVVVNKYSDNGRQTSSPADLDDPRDAGEWLFGESNGEEKINQNTEGKNQWDAIVDWISKSPQSFEGCICALQKIDDGANYTAIKDEIGFEGSTDALKQRIYRLRKDLRN